MSGKPDRSTVEGGPLPSHVALILAFTNSVDHDLGTDDLTTPADLSRWLESRGLLQRHARATGADLVLARNLRDGLHAALVANHEGAQQGPGLGDAARELPLRLSGTAGAPALAPVEEGVRGALSQVLIAVNSAVGDGSWPRLHVCASDECEWAYYDRSKNRSRSWCEWGCGNKIKTRNYRARRRAVVGPAA